MCVNSKWRFGVPDANGTQVLCHLWEFQTDPLPTIDEMAAGNALAGGAVAASLVETLFDKGILTLDEARGVLDRASRCLSPVVSTPAGIHAARVIGGMLQTKFSARR